MIVFMFEQKCFEDHGGRHAFSIKSGSVNKPFVSNSLKCTSVPSLTHHRPTDTVHLCAETDTHTDTHTHTHCTSVRGDGARCERVDTHANTHTHTCTHTLYPRPHPGDWFA
jgi:NADH pyrophosphatase NudC (nudix superfamily)